MLLESYGLTDLVCIYSFNYRLEEQFATLWAGSPHFPASVLSSPHPVCNFCGRVRGRNCAEVPILQSVCAASANCVPRLE
jgi:hypothetical protein